MPLNIKLIVLAVIPLAMLIFFMLEINVERMEKINVIESYLQRASDVEQVGLAIDELQSERRYSFGFLLKKEWRNELVIQRPKTDAIIEHLENSNEFRGLRSYTFLDSLGSIRRKIDDNAVTPEEVMTFYTSVILRLHSLNNISSGNVILKPVFEDITSQKILTGMITNLGIQRSTVYQDIYLGRISPVLREKLRTDYRVYST